MKFALAAAALLLFATPALAAQPADGVYACARGDVALGDIEIAGLTAKSRAPGGAFGAAGDYIMLDDTSLYWLTDPEILTAGGYPSTTPRPATTASLSPSLPTARARSKRSRAPLARRSASRSQSVRGRT